MAIGDVDNDYHVDIVTVDNKALLITVHYFDPNTLKFKASHPIPFDTVISEPVH